MALIPSLHTTRSSTAAIGCTFHFCNILPVLSGPKIGHSTPGLVLWLLRGAILSSLSLPAPFLPAQPSTRQVFTADRRPVSVPQDAEVLAHQYGSVGLVLCSVFAWLGWNSWGFYQFCLPPCPSEQQTYPPAWQLLPPPTVYLIRYKKGTLSYFNQHAHKEYIWYV